MSRRLLSPSVLALAFLLAALFVAVWLGRSMPVGRGPGADRRDPLPPGAIARLGTTRYRTLTWNSAASLSPDGKSLLFQPAEGQLAVMDVATGLVTRRMRYPDTEPWDHDRARGMLHSPDGKRAILWGDRSQVVVDLPSGRERARLPGRLFMFGRHSGTALSFSADGGRVAIGTDRAGIGEPVRVWDVVANRTVATFKPLQNETVSVALSRDGTTLATWGRHHDRQRPDGSWPPDSGMEDIVQVWDVDRQTERFRVAAWGPSAAAFTPDGKTLAVYARRGAVMTFDVAAGVYTREFPCPDGMYPMTFSPDGRWLAGPGSRGVNVWDFATGRRVASVESPVWQTDGLVFTANDRAVAWALRAGLVILWEVPSGRLLTPLVGHWSEVTSIAFGPDGKTVLSGAGDRQLMEWDIATGQPRSIPLHVGSPSPPALGGALDRLPLPPGLRRPPQPQINPHFGSVLHRGTTTVSPDGSHVVVAGESLGSYLSEPEVILFQRATGNVVTMMNRGGGSYNPTRVAVFSADGTRFVLPAYHRQEARTDPTMLPVWETASGRPLGEVPVPAKEITAAAFSPDGTRLVTVTSARDRDRRTGGDFDSTVVVTGWDLTTGRKLGELTRPSDFTYTLTVAAADNTTAVVISSGQLWEVDYERGRLGRVIDRVVPEFEWRRHAVCPPLFSPDGKLLAAGIHLDRPDRFGVRLYEWPSGKVLHTFTGHAGPVTALAFSPDGKTLATGSQDTTVLLWDLTK